MSTTLSALQVMTLSGGINTALSAPASTALTIGHMAIVPNYPTGSSSAFVVWVRVGPTAGTPKTWLHTSVTASGGAQFNGPVTLSPGWGVIISASTGSAMDFVAFGLEVK